MDALAKLVELGFLVDAGASDAEIADALREFQRDRWLVEDGVLGRVTARHLARPGFCGVIPQRLSRGQVCRWDTVAAANGWNGKQFTRPENDREPIVLRWHFSNPPAAIYREMMYEALRRVSEVCAVVFEEVANADAANFLEVMGDIDGRGATLAWHYLPCGREHETTLLKGKEGVSGQFESAEAWDLSPTAPQRGRTSWIGTVIHEIGGHGLGLEHGPETSVMSAYSNNVTEVDAWMVAELVKRYGPPLTRVTVPSPGVPYVTGELRDDRGHIYRFDAKNVGEGQ